MFLEMLTGALPEEKQSYDNINICILVSTSLMFLTCIMEALTFFWYNNKVSLSYLKLAEINNIHDLTIFSFIQGKISSCIRKRRLENIFFEQSYFKSIERCHKMAKRIV